MERVGLLVREQIVTKIKDESADIGACLFVSFEKTPAFSLNMLRNDLRDAGVRLFISKNSLASK